MHQEPSETEKETKENNARAKPASTRLSKPHPKRLNFPDGTEKKKEITEGRSCSMRSNRPNWEGSKTLLKT